MASLPVSHESASLDGRLRLLLIGVDHRTAPLALRERVAYSAAEAQALLERLVEQPEIAEACLLSTCNRTELYVEPNDEAAAYRKGLEMAFLARAPEIEEEGRFYVKRDFEAARHLHEVASGLQSMILGEPEILGQVKQANGWAETVGTAGVTLGRLLRSSIGAGGRARRETGIASGAASFGYAVVDLARNIFQRIENSAVLVIGAGEMARQVARGFAESGVRELWVANRNPERAAAFRELFPIARILSFEGRFEGLAKCDIAVASTGADEPILRQDQIAEAMDKRRGRPLLLADLGVPRNIDPSVRSLENVFLQDIDSLEDLIARNLKRRREEIPKVQEILDRELRLFADWHRGRSAEPVVARLQKRAEALRRRELEAVRDRFPAETHDDLDKLTRALVRKLLHHPSAQLRHPSLDPEKLEFVRQIFQLDEEK